MIIRKKRDNNQVSRRGMGYKQYERKAHIYQEKAIEKNGENQRRKIREKLIKANDHWNDLELQMNWNKLEWVYPKKEILKGVHSVLLITSYTSNM